MSFQCQDVFKGFFLSLNIILSITSFLMTQESLFIYLVVFVTILVLKGYKNLS
jgi:hypothetical protein